MPINCWNKQTVVGGSKLKMANITVITLVLVVILCCQSAYGNIQFFSLTSKDSVAALIPSASDGLCKIMVEPFGYACEDHTVTTKDGFIIGLQRMPKGKAGGAQEDKPPVLLQHGQLLDGATWVVLSPNQSLAFILADNGYDVWLANSRGSRYSNTHIALSPNDTAFWDWSWDELAAYDLTASMQYVRNQTGQNVHYVGYSLGGLLALASLSKDQSLDTMRSAAILGPTAYMNHIKSPYAKALANIMLANKTYWLKVAEFDPAGPIGLTLLADLCKAPGVNCTDLLTSSTGQNCCINPIKVLTLLAKAAPTATKNLIHLAQMIKQGTIGMFDYDNADENMKHYGIATPPVYNMSAIPNDFPLFVAHGGIDELADPEDIQELLDNLKDHAKDKLVVKYIENYGHGDYVFGENANQVLYDPLMAFFKSL